MGIYQRDSEVYKARYNGSVPGPPDSRAQGYSRGPVFHPSPPGVNSRRLQHAGNPSGGTMFEKAIVGGREAGCCSSGCARASGFRRGCQDPSQVERAATADRQPSPTAVSPTNGSGGPSMNLPSGVGPRAAHSSAGSPASTPQFPR